ncbi:hypothetical protein M9Y10_045820 [Tritrichomonas musculus]|uniref:Protein kinase domain-containing protein n=1 Tax=Tritrichomonas musculus TaxID=1915356 RepID=A0ABR2JY27_9EUKA
MGCCSSSVRVANKTTKNNNTNSTSDTEQINPDETNKNINNDNNDNPAEDNNPEIKAQDDPESSKINTDSNEKIEPDGSTVSDDNTDNEDGNSYLGYQSFCSEDEYNLAGYKYEKAIGKGRSAEVVQMSKDGVSYAVKIIDLSLNSKPNYLQDDREPTEEVAILKRFDHIHVVKFVDFIDDTDNDKLFIVMELLSGGTIMNCTTFEEKKEAFTEALSAVHYIHFQRIAHQDIKPENILRDEDGTIKLVDFGSAVFVSEGVKKISSGLIGTYAYTPPEKLTEESYDPFLGDIWSLGATLYTMLFGKPPFAGSTIFQLQQSIINDDLEFPENADKDAVDLIQLMMKKIPDHRIKCGHIWDHPFLEQIPTTSSVRSLLDSSSRIFESLKMSDTMNSISRISRGSLRSSLKGSIKKAMQKQASKMNKKKQKKTFNKHKSQIKKKETKHVPININEYDSDYDSPKEAKRNEVHLVDVNSSSEGSLEDQASSILSIQKQDPNQRKHKNNIKQSKSDEVEKTEKNSDKKQNDENIKNDENEVGTKSENPRKLIKDLDQIVKSGGVTPRQKDEKQGSSRTNKDEKKQKRNIPKPSKK